MGKNRCGFSGGVILVPLMSARRLASVRDYDSLHRAVRTRVEELGVSRSSIDAASGLQDGYASKILSPIPIKGLGRQSLGPMLQALGLALEVVVIEEQPRIVESGTKTASHDRRAKRASIGAANMPEVRAMGRKALRLMLRDNAKKGARARTRSLTPERRQQIARKAAKARWRAWRRTRRGTPTHITA
jgi:hypothetical protein